MHCTGARAPCMSARTESPLKAALLDQSVVAGLGNLCADEVLLHAGVDPHRDDRLGRLELSDQGLARRDRYPPSTAPALIIALVTVPGAMRLP